MLAGAQVWDKDPMSLPGDYLSIAIPELSMIHGFVEDGECL
jgi:hypothetical protein